MTAQLPLPLAPAEASSIGAAAALVEDADGGRVFLHGELCYAWNPGDELSRRLTAVQLVRIKAATARAVAEAFKVTAVTLWRWSNTLSESGAVGLTRERPGPRGPSKLTAKLAAEIRARRERRESLRAIAEATGTSTATVRRALAEEGAAADDEPEQADAGVAKPDVEDPVADTNEAQETASGTIVDAGEHDAGEQDAGSGTEPLPLLPDPASRLVERGLARWGLLEHADPVFTPAGRVPLAGLLLALPGLEATGLLACAEEVYGRLRNGFYGLHTILLEAVLRCLAGEPRTEGATRVDPVALGRVLGLDRAPEVKTIRRKFNQLASVGKTEGLLAQMARHHLHQAEQTDPDLVAVLYVDGHTRAYHGKRRIAKTHVARLRFPAPATVETWVSDAAGDPVLVVMAEPGASLASELRRLLPDLREAIGDDRRVLVGFDRGGWSPRLFKEMYDAKFDVLTWRKGNADDVPEAEFTDVTYTDDGRRHTWNTAETMVELPLDDNGNETFTMRQVTRRDGPGERQVHMLTTATQQVLPIGEVNFRMGSRWRQENSFRYGRMHFDLDSHDSYRHGDDDPGRSVPNPAKKQAQKMVAAARARCEREAARADAALLALRSPASGQTVVISNAKHNRVTKESRAAEADLAAAEDVNRDTPARLPLGQVDPGQQILEVQTKLLTHTVKIAAFNTATALARDIRLHTSYARAKDEAYALIRQVLTHSGDIDPDVDNGSLTVRLDPMPTARATRAVAELCEHLTNTKTHYPGTNLTMQYQIKS